MVIRAKLVQEIQSERPLPGGRELVLTFRAGSGHAVPALLLLPSLEAPAPAAVLVHGYSSRKEDVSGTVGKALLAKGIASLAIDLPLHGSRAGPNQDKAFGNPAEVMSLWRQALRDVKLALRYAAARPEIDKERLALVGYSMGSFLSTVIAAEDPSVKALIVASGGDLPDHTPFSALARMVADPLRAVRRLDGRPLLIVHGRSDRTVKPEQAQRLFDAALEPKELLWFDAGHRLPPAAGDAAAEWLARKI